MQAMHADQGGCNLEKKAEYLVNNCQCGTAFPLP